MTDYTEHVSTETADAGADGDTGRDGRRPSELGAALVEPRCGDIVRFNHLDERPYFKIGTTSRYEDEENRYGFHEIGGNRAFTMTESEYVALYDTDKSALWPTLFAEIDLFRRRRDPETGNITRRGSSVDMAADAGAEDEDR